MSVFGSAEELGDSPKVSGNLNRRTFTRTFRVKTTDVLNDGPATVSNAPGVPLLYSAYVFGSESDAYALCRNLEIERFQNASPWWKVVATYETPDDHNASEGTKREQPGALENPLLMLPEVETATLTKQVAVYSVFNLTTGKLEPCQASTGQVFDPPPMKDQSTQTLSITRNEPLTSPHPDINRLYADRVNLDPFWGCPPGCWKVQSIVARRERKQLPNGLTFDYLKCSYKFELRADGWDTQILDSGSWFFDFAGRKIQFKTGDGHPRTGALDGLGKELADGATPVFVTYRFYPRVLFAALQLPQSFSQVA